MGDEKDIGGRLKPFVRMNIPLIGEPVNVIMTGAGLSYRAYKHPHFNSLFKFSLKGGLYPDRESIKALSFVSSS